MKKERKKSKKSPENIRQKATNKNGYAHVYTIREANR